MPLRLPRGLAPVAIDPVAPIAVAGAGAGVVGGVAVRIADRLGVADGQALPGHIGPDQRGLDMNHLAPGDPGLDAGDDGPFQNAAEPLRPLISAVSA